MNTKFAIIKSEFAEKLDFYKSCYDATVNYSSLSPYGQMMANQVTNSELILSSSLQCLRGSFWYLFVENPRGASTSEKCAAAVAGSCELPSGYTFLEALNRLDLRQLAAVVRLLELRN